MLWLVVQSCPTLWDPMDCSPPGSCPWGFSRQEYWSGRHTLLQGILPTPGLNPDLLHCRWILQPLSHLEQSSVQFSSVQSCPAVCNSMDCSTSGFPVHHQLPELTQTHVHWIVMPSNHLILCGPLLLLPSIFPRIRSLRQKHGSAGASCRVGGRVQLCMHWSFEGSHHYLYYFHHGLASGQATGRNTAPPNKKHWIKDLLSIAPPIRTRPSFPSVRLFHQEASISLLSFSIRGQTDWKPQSQKTDQSDHKDHSLV